MTSTAPRKPWTQVDSDAHPKLTTKSGMAKGTTTNTAQIRRPGRSVRSTHHAARVPMTAHSTVTTTVSRMVFHSSVPVSGRKIRWTTVDSPAPLASMTRKTSGTSRTMATAVLATRRILGRRALRAGTGVPVVGGGSGPATVVG